MKRLEQLPTLRIDPAQKISFTYNDKPHEGVGGDTLATALFAGGVRIFGRSLKYHRPRGLYSMDAESSNTMLSVDGIPNVVAEVTALKNGMAAKPQNVKGSAENDLMGFMDKLSWAMPAGFYYRSMHKPAKAWPIAIKQIRKAAGLGVLSPDFRMPGTYEEIYPTADVLVLGGGPAGMCAALAAAEQGLRVILIEKRPWLGGFFDYRATAYDADTPLYQRARDLAAQVTAADNIRVFTHTATIGAYNNNLVTAFQVGTADDHFDERYIEIRAKSMVVATGCIERPLLFENNERPGVMQAGCAQRLARTYGVLPGETAVFSVGHDLGLEAAIDLHDLGLKITCVADIREDGQNLELVAALAERKIPLLRGWLANDTQGKKRVEKVTLSSLTGLQKQEYECDLLVASAGMTPVSGPITMAQGKLEFDHHTGFFLPVELPWGVHVAGRVIGLTDSHAIEASGHQAGLAAANDCGADVGGDLEQAKQNAGTLPGPERGCKLISAPVKGGKSFICFDEDTTVKNIRQAIKDGFDVTELIKRYTAAGTGPGQGGISGHNLPMFVAQYHADPDITARPTTVRAPLTPVYLATMAGSSHDMCKRTPMHEPQKAAGGILRRIGVWRRARYFSEDFSCEAEIENVRNNVGMLDASTLGKFRIWGPDALKALQRVYVSDMSKMTEGKIKYSVMCNEDGCIVDDGVVIKQGENDYYLTTSTGRAGQTVEWLRYHTRYDGWNFNMVNLTDALGVINLAGPNARKVFAKITAADLSNEAFPFAGYAELTVLDDIPVRAMRLGFVGELSYELHVPSSYMQAVWEALEAAGQEFGIRNFGLEAQNVLRMEKGHLIIGSESEQRTTLHDVGLGFLWSRNKPEAKTVGAVALEQTLNQKDRLKLVGIKMEQANQTPKDGSIVVDSKIRGYVCIARNSFNVKASVGMALVDAPLAETGKQLEIFEDGAGDRRIIARVVPLPFYDPEGKRMKM
jgi:sarcosine oxidase, subunit alpha